MNEAVDSQVDSAKAKSHVQRNKQSCNQVNSLDKAQHFELNSYDILNMKDVCGKTA